MIKISRILDKKIKAKSVFESKTKSADANWILQVCKSFAWLLERLTNAASGISDPLPLNIFWEDEGLWNLMSVQHLSKFMVALHVWYRWKASIWGALSLAE